MEGETRRGWSPRRTGRPSRAAYGNPEGMRRHEMAIYRRQRYLLMTTDPVHIGTGGYRLGRVDQSIVREPGTGVPKIPGTTLHGAARSYAAQLYETPEAAGQSHDHV